jgi:hypothetical protein
VLFALRQPGTLLGLVLAYLLGSFLQVVAQRFVISGRRGLRGVTAAHQWLDPYGAVAALLGGIGWAPRQELDRRRPNLALLLVVVAVAVEAVLAALGILGFRLAGAPLSVLGYASTIDVVHGHQILTQAFFQRVALGFAVESMACGLLCLVPVPPLALGVWLWSVLPKTPGARRVSYHLLEEHWGIAVLLILLLVPLAGQEPVLLDIAGAIVDPILHAI